MAHQAMIDTDIVIKIEALPQHYAATLVFAVKGNHLLDIHLTDKHLDQLVAKINALRESQST
ncbi:MAG: hypothetical protein BWK79_13855 [Beggiatoa sp. IS2]|nr:MAG: hypothetical protein BWK79_13855 [Beggiatoa sp. IS2]